jgi:hypothetical protein
LRKPCAQLCQLEQAAIIVPTSSWPRQNHQWCCNESMFCTGGSSLVIEDQQVMCCGCSSSYLLPDANNLTGRGSPLRVTSCSISQAAARPGAAAASHAQQAVQAQVVKPASTRDTATRRSPAQTYTSPHAASHTLLSSIRHINSRFPLASAR